MRKWSGLKKKKKDLRDLRRKQRKCWACRDRQRRRCLRACWSLNIRCWWSMQRHCLRVPCEGRRPGSAGSVGRPATYTIIMKTHLSSPVPACPVHVRIDKKQRLMLLDGSKRIAGRRGGGRKTKRKKKKSVCTAKYIKDGARRWKNKIKRKK